ncbi:MAG: response regulator transcription factor [Sphingobacteriia bacterium]|nr:response regulator transcription factor [Sphingobacteriia bacterium]
MIHFAIVDNQPVFRKALKQSLEETGAFNCLLEAENGICFIEGLNQHAMQLDFVLIDIMMPQKNGIETLAWINKKYPFVKVVLMPFYEDSITISRLMNLGADGYFSKLWDIDLIKESITKICVADKEIKSHSRKKVMVKDIFFITDREKQLLKLASTDLTYEQIACSMNLSFKTIDKYRSSLFKKFDVKSRAGLVINALKLGMLELAN